MTIRLNIGCGGDLLKGYINVDIHSKEEIEERDGIKLANDIKIENLDIFNLPYKESTVDNVMCIGFLEHLSFENEGRLLKEVQRVLMKGGVFRFTVPDFDNLCKQWLEAKDNFIDFYKIGTDEHWFGNGDRNIKNKWGYLLASFFGNQSCDGQFHRNAWTKKKIEKIMETLGFFYDIDTFYFKNTEILMLGCTAVKK